MTTEEKATAYAERYEARPMAETAIRAYIAGATEALVSQWRSAEDELPEDGETVLLSINGSRLTGYYSHDDELWEVDGIGAYERNDVSHWCKLPSLPDTNTEKK